MAIADIKFSMLMVEQKLKLRCRNGCMKHMFDKWTSFVIDKKEKKDFSESFIVMTPVAAGMSHRDYKEQKCRISRGEQHCWDDSKNNNAKVGDLFAYVTNKCNGDHIEIYEIKGVGRPHERLSTWSGNVGQQGRNVVLLSSHTVYVGSWSEFKYYCDYADNYNCQGTMRMGFGKSSKFISKMLS